MEEEEKQHRLLLMASPLQGHMTPLLHLAHILFSKGFSITILHTLFSSPDPDSYPHFSFHAIPDGLSEAEASTLDAVHLTDLINTRCAHPLKECLPSLLSDSPQPVPCFISDAALHFTQPICDEFKLPRLVLRTGGASSFLVFASFPLLREKGYLPVQESRLEEPVVDFPPLKVKDLPKFQSQDPEAFYKLVCRFVEECKASSGVIWNTFEELESAALTKLRQDFSLPIYPIGPFHKRLLTGSASSSASLLTPDKSCISWLDKQEHNSVVYVSFGSIAAISEAEFLEIAWGLANSQQPFLWVIRPGSIRDSEGLEALPSGFLENLGGRGYIVKWAPQEQVLSHPAVGSFWTHNGWNSTLECICEGVPMICMPFFADQKVNAKYASSVWKVGVQLENKLERANVSRWPARLHTPPDRLQSIKFDAFISRNELFKAESKYWGEIIASYVRVLHWKKMKLRNVMDMKAGFGGFAAALIDQNLDSWVMNVVPVSGSNTLPVIYDRGLIGVMHDWCEPFDTYPRTYDLLHAANLLSVEKKRCNVSSIMLEMDRILRPGGRAYIRDTLAIMDELIEIGNAIGWHVTLRDTSEGPHASYRVLVCDKRLRG